MWEIIRNNLEPIKAALVRSLLGFAFPLPAFSFSLSIIILWQGWQGAGQDAVSLKRGA
jgi:hypothetical protein